MTIIDTLQSLRDGDKTTSLEAADVDAAIRALPAAALCLAEQYRKERDIAYWLLRRALPMLEHSHPHARILGEISSMLPDADE